MADENQFKGTIVDNPEMDAEKSAIRFSKAMKGMGSDERVIIQQLVNHTNMQRTEIQEKYKIMYGKDLVDDLKDELGGHFEETTVALFTSPYDLIVQALNQALTGPFTNESILIELLCSRPGEELESLNWWYESTYTKTLDDALIGDLSGDFRSLMRGLVSGGREEDQTKDAARARKDAQDLYDAGIGQNSGTDEDEFIRIINTRSYPQLQETFEAYDRLAQESIEVSLEKEFGGDMLNGLKAIVQRVKDPCGFFAERLFTSMDGAGTDDKSLIRLIVSRSEIDLADIKTRYKEMYDTKMYDAVKDETGGDYGKLLLAIIGKD